ncbi:MAG: glycosyltransferase [Bdellovibrionota bacterium]
MLDNPRLAVIIPTRGRDGCLRQTLRDLKTQDYSNFEVWVVDQNDVPLKNLQEELGTRIKLHHEVMPPLGSHAGRNHAILRTQAEVLVFVDDDVRVEVDFLKRHVTAFRDAKGPVSAVAGRVIQPKDGYTPEEMKVMGRRASYNRWLGRVSGNFVGSESAYVDHIHECNFSIIAKDLKEIGGFNEEFKGNAYFEGADLALRLIRQGKKILYRPEVCLVHLQEGAGGNRVTDKARHTYWYMRNYGLLNSLHMKPIGLPVYAVFGAAYVLGKALKNANPEIAFKGFSGLFSGLSYFRPGSVREKTLSTKKPD